MGARCRIWAATVFLDYVTTFTHVVLIADQSAEETLRAKHEFEQVCATRGVKVKAYHADNGRSAESSFISDVKKSFQYIVFCDCCLSQLELHYYFLCPELIWPQKVFCCPEFFWPQAYEAKTGRNWY